MNWELNRFEFEFEFELGRACPAWEPGTEQFEFEFEWYHHGHFL